MSRRERQERSKIARSQEEAEQQQRREHRQKALDTQAGELETLRPADLRHLAALAIVAADNVNYLDNYWADATAQAHRTAEYTRATALISLANLVIAQPEVVNTDN